MTEAEIKEIYTKYPVTRVCRVCRVEEAVEMSHHKEGGALGIDVFKFFCRMCDSVGDPSSNVHLAWYAWSTQDHHKVEDDLQD